MGDLEIVNSEHLNTIAAEIRTIQNTTRKVMLAATIQIGERLAEAKAVIGHGNWLGWLEANTNFKERQAQRAMRLWQEYGQGQQVLFGKSFQEEELAALTSTQAEILLGIKDPDERVEFVQNHDLDSMSTRELQEAVKAREKAEAQINEALQLAGEMEQKAKEAEKKAGDAHVQLCEAQKQAKALQEELEKLKEEQESSLSPDMDSETNKRIHDLEVELAAAKGQKVKAEKELEDLKNQPIDVATIEKVPDEIQKELEELRAKAKAQAESQPDTKMAQFKVHLLTIKDQLKAMEEIVGRMDAETKRSACGAMMVIADKLKTKAETLLPE